MKTNASKKFLILITRTKRRPKGEMKLWQKDY